MGNVRETDFILKPVSIQRFYRVVWRITLRVEVVEYHSIEDGRASLVVPKRIL